MFRLPLLNGMICGHMLWPHGKPGSGRIKNKRMKKTWSTLFYIVIVAGLGFVIYWITKQGNALQTPALNAQQLQTAKGTSSVSDFRVFTWILKIIINEFFCPGIKLCKSALVSNPQRAIIAPVDFVYIIAINWCAVAGNIAEHFHSMSVVSYKAIRCAYPYKTPRILKHHPALISRKTIQHAKTIKYRLGKRKEMYKEETGNENPMPEQLPVW